MTTREPDATTAWQAIHRVLPPGRDTGGSRDALYHRGGRRVGPSSLRIDPGTRASFATYFGAFPAMYWRAHTTLRDVRLALHIDGVGEVVIRRTDNRGAVSTVRRIEMATGEVSVPLTLGADDGWIWCEISIEGAHAAIASALRWEAAVVQPTATATVAITTFDREADCLRVLQRLAADPTVLNRIERIVVADQGNRRIAEATGFPATAAMLGDRLKVIVQPNLGGSGGFSRGMLEAAEGTATHVLLLDDDVEIEPESILRMLSFAERAPSPNIVGAQMLSLVEQTRVHSWGEAVDRRTTWWHPVAPEMSGIDLAAQTVDDSRSLSRAIDVDYNGWWMCLVPLPLVREHGASLPMFIKWDDAEFGLRAQRHGVTTVSLPGAAIWHLPWTAKDDGLDWQAYFQLRNRLVTALLHGGRGVLRASLPQDVNHVLCAQYGSVALRSLAVEDVMSGPSHLDVHLHDGRSRALRLLALYGQMVMPESEPGGAAATPVPAPPRGAAGMMLRIIRVALHQLRGSSAAAIPLRLTRAEGKWWALGVLDAASVDAAAGEGVFVLRRERGVAFRELRRAVVLRARLWRRWRRLAAEYGSAAPALSSLDAWRARLEPPAESRRDA